MEKVDNPVNGVYNVDDPREVVDDVKKRIFVLDRLDGLVEIEEEEDDHPEEVDEAEDCAPVAPEKVLKPFWKHLYSLEPGLLFQVFFRKQYCCPYIDLRTSFTF